MTFISDFASPLQLSSYPQVLAWAAVSFGAGFIIHASYFCKGELDLAAKSICRAYASSLALYVTVRILTKAATQTSDIFDAFVEVCTLLTAHGAGLALSICIYRVFLHRLSSFPGPALASFSGFYMLGQSLVHHQSDALLAFHNKYGDYVRVCPNKLSITDPAAITAIYGRNSPTSKGPFTNTNPRANLNMTRDKMEHNRRRKFWDRAFSTASLRSRVQVINKHAQRLLNQLQARAGQSTDVTRLVGLFSFDVLFDMGFSQDKKSLDSGHEDFYMETAQHVMWLTGLCMHVPWLMSFVAWIPSLGARLGQFGQLSADIVDDRLTNTGDRGDLFSVIASSYDELKNTSAHDLENIAGDADLLVLAGADSIKAAIANILYELAFNSVEQERLRQALAGVESFEEFQVLGHPVMDAVIHECLRLSPPAPAGHERLTPPGGLRIGERFIPGNVSVFIPHYALFRDPRFFCQPTTFLPERWTTRPELNKDASVFFPFMIGRNTCAGRQLALMEMRTVVARIVSRYAIQPADPGIKTEFVNKRDDRWLLAVGELNIVLRELDVKGS